MEGDGAEEHPHHAGEAAEEEGGGGGGADGARLHAVRGDFVDALVGLCRERDDEAELLFVLGTGHCSIVRTG